MRQVPTREFPTKFLGLVSIFQIWDFCGYSLNTPRYPKMGICYFFLWAFSPFDLKVQSPPRDPPTFSPYHVVHYVWNRCHSDWCNAATQIVFVDTAHSRLLLRNFSAPVFELWGTPSICDKLTTWLILWFVSKKLCSSLKTFGKTCKKPAATWLDIWAPLLSWVSRSLTLFLFSFS